MSMSELTDDQLDGLFRKSAEEFDPPFDPTAWQDMKNRLDTHDRPTPGGTPIWQNLLRWGLPICLLLLTIGGLYLYRYNADRGSSPHRNATATQPPNTGAQEEINKASIKQPTTDQQLLTDADFTSTTTSTGSPAAGDPAKSTGLTTKSTRLPKPAGEQSVRVATPAKPNQPSGLVNRADQTSTPSTTDETNAPSVAYEQKTGSANQESDLAGKTSTSLMDRSIAKAHNTRSTRQRRGGTATNRLLAKKQRQAEWLDDSQTHLTENELIVSTSAINKRSLKKAVNKSRQAITSNLVTSYQPVVGQAESVGLPDVRELTIQPANWPKPLVFTERTIDIPPIEARPMAVASTMPVEKGLSVRLAVAPDLSSIGLRNFARPGTNVGVLMEYRLAPRWSVQTGIIQSTKIYRASATDYELADYYRKAMYTIPQGADGQCKMLDIPVNIRYDVLLKPRADGRVPSRWFVSGGVTSYIIEKEDYVYKYSGYVHKAIPDWSGKSGSYGFSQLNLSVGYERALTKRLSWQIEPFMKMPLKGVGYLNLNLLSTGTFFSIRYKL